MNNFATPALAALITEFFYTGASALGPIFPKVFGCEAPKVAICLAATAVMFPSCHSTLQMTDVLILYISCS